MEILANRQALVKRSRNLFIASVALLVLTCLWHLLLLSLYIRSGLSNQFSNGIGLGLTWLFIGIVAVFFTGLEMEALRTEVYSREEASRMRSELPRWYTFLSFKRDSASLYAVAHSSLWARIVTAALFVYILGFLILGIINPTLRSGLYFLGFSAIYADIFWTFALFSSFTLHYLAGDEWRLPDKAGA